MKKPTIHQCCNARNEHEHLPDGTVRFAMSRGRYGLVDEADWANICQWMWCFDGSYVRRMDRGKPVYLHRSIMAAPPGVDVDHVSRDRLDNRRTNLREATRGENGCNRGPASSNTSGYKGVSWHKQNGYWRAQIKAGGRVVHLGVFSLAEEAARAYDKAARELHGAFAYQNFPTMQEA